MRRIALLLLLTVACRTVPVGGSAAASSPGTTGATSARAAVDRFLAAARAQDIATVGNLFGDEQGPARDRDDRRAFEQRAVIMICALQHDQAKVTEGATAIGGKIVFSVDLVQGLIQATTRFTAVRGPGERWYVSEFDIVALQNKGFCRNPGAPKVPVSR